MAATGDSMQDHLARLDPSMAAVLGHIVGNTSKIDDRSKAVEASQVAMQDSFQSQIDRLNAAVLGNGGSNTAGGSSGGNGVPSIEHMFQQQVTNGDNFEAVIAKHVEKAVSGLGSTSLDPFQPVVNSQGEWYPCKAWGFGVPVKLSRDAYREIVNLGLAEAGF